MSVSKPSIASQEFEQNLAGLERPISEGTRLYGLYEEKRFQALEAQKPEGQELSQIQDSVSQWIEQENLLSGRQDYELVDENGRYSKEDLVNRKIGGLIEFLRENHSDQVSEEELEASSLFVKASVSMYKETPDEGVHPDAKGAFAFVAPIRTSKITPEYGSEIEPIIPAFRYLPNELRSQMIVGLPPLIIDSYEPLGNGRRGYVVFCPISPDMAMDSFEAFGELSDEQQQAAQRRVAEEANGTKHEKMHPAQWDSWQQAKRIINQTVDYARRRHGVDVAGLSATLPAMTDLGRMIENDEVVITTGHGSTAFLIKEAMKAVVEKGVASEKALGRIGVLGAGAIGSALARVVNKEFPEAALRIHDKRPDRAEAVIESIADHKGVIINSASEKELLEGSDIVLTAITSQPPLEGINLEGTIIIDDSQPGAFSPKEVEDRGGFMFWPLGIDTTGQIRRQMFDYGTMVPPDHLETMFTCEAEVSTLYRELQRMRAGDLTEGEQAHIDAVMTNLNGGPKFVDRDEAIKHILQEEYATIGPVTWDKSEKTGEMLDRHHVTVTRNWQALGRHSIPHTQV